jgi:uncharacterized protein (TIGR03437 family)
MWRAARLALSFGLLFFTGASRGFCVDLSISGQAAGPGASVVIPISFASHGQTVSGLQFDLVVNNAALTLAPIIGDAPRNSGKTMYVASPSPNLTRILITELNQNAISDGGLVDLFVNIAPAALPGSYPLHFQSAFACDAVGHPVAVTTTDGSITVGSASGAPVSSEGVLNGASLLPGPIAPGEIITIIGSAITSSSAPQNTRVSFDGFAAPLLYTASNQINAIVPFEIDGQSIATMQIAGLTGLRTEVPLAVASAAPAIFTLGAGGAGQGAILNQDSTVNSPENPAQPGSIIAFFATGAGQTNPPGTDGLISTLVLPQPRLPVSVQVAGANAEILYAGAAPGMIAGVLQVNCRIPVDLPAGASIPLVLTVGEAASPPVMVAVR